MADGKVQRQPRNGGRPGWVVPSAFALTFVLSFVMAEVFGPTGALLGLAAGAGIGWAATRWIWTSKGTGE